MSQIGFPLPFRSYIGYPFCNQRGGYSSKCCMSFSHPRHCVNLTDPQVFVDLFYVGTKKEAGTVTDPTGGPEEENVCPIG